VEIEHKSKFKYITNYSLKISSNKDIYITIVVMQESNQFKKLPLPDRTALTDIDDPVELYKYINDSIDRQNTVKSKSVRRSVFRGLLRKFKNLSNDDMKAIEATTEQKQAYFESNQVGLQSQTESKMSQELFNSIVLSNPIVYLLCTSGLRISELLSNKYEITGNTVKFELNKKRVLELREIHIVGSISKWIKLFKSMRKETDNTTEISIINRINVLLKTIIPATFYKQSSHIARGIYINLVKVMLEPNMTLPNIITKYLNHDRPTASIHYQNIVMNIKKAPVTKMLMVVAKKLI